MADTAQSVRAAQDAVATIVNSGSTNRSGFRIVLRRSGAAEYSTIPRGAQSQRAQPEHAAKRILEDLSRRLFADLEAARPLASLPAPHCAKSVSFGSRLTVEFAGETTPDLSCGDGGDERLRALIRDVNEAVALFSGK